MTVSKQVRDPPCLTNDGRSCAKPPAANATAAAAGVLAVLLLVPCKVGGIRYNICPTHIACNRRRGVKGSEVFFFRWGRKGPLFFSLVGPDSERQVTTTDDIRSSMLERSAGSAPKVEPMPDCRVFEAIEKSRIPSFFLPLSGRGLRRRKKGHWGGFGPFVLRLLIPRQHFNHSSFAWNGARCR